MSTPPLAGAGMPPGAFSGTQAQAAREVNTASLCRIGQETVQDIVFRTMEIFQLLRNMQQKINNHSRSLCIFMTLAVSFCSYLRYRYTYLEFANCELTLIVSLNCDLGLIHKLSKCNTRITTVSCSSILKTFTEKSYRGIDNDQKCRIHEAVQQR
nr:PREDICTED: mediator of RNA polymerase II transcription subunit 30 isoform X2 [Haliaeetus albicilla]